MKNYKQRFQYYMGGWPILAILQPNNPDSNLFVGTGVTGDNFASILTFVLRTLMTLVGFVASVFLILGAYYYMVSGANEDLAKKGKKMMTNAIIGLVVAVLSYVIITVAQNAATGTV